MANKYAYDLGKIVLGTVATKVAGMSLDWLLNTKKSTAKLSSNGDSQNGSNSMYNATSNSTGINETAQPTITDPYYKSSWADTLKTIGYTASVAIPAYSMLQNLFGNRGSSTSTSSSSSKSSNNNTIKPNISSTVNPSINPEVNVENEVDVDVENEVDYTPSSFHNFVPTINISTPEYNPQPQLPRIEINPKSNVYIPYEAGYKSVPKTKNKTHPIYNLDWMYTTTYSPGFCNI